jgi:DNA-directed RNA polymerase subunit RPC12/RpoP
MIERSVSTWQSGPHLVNLSALPWRGDSRVNRFKCPSCGKRVKYGDEHLGKKLKCPRCSHSIVVPGEFPFALPVNTDASKVATPRRPRVSMRTTLAFATGTAMITAGAVCIWLIIDRHRSADGQAPGAPPVALASSETHNNELAKQAQAVLRTNCFPCHGGDGSAEGGFNYVLDLPRLLATKKIVPHNAKVSPVYQRLFNKEMPPEDAKHFPSDSDIALVKQWIEAGALDFSTSAVAKADTVRPDKLLALIRDDLKTLDERDRRFTRYFTFTHLANAGFAEDDLQSYRNGLSKLVNSLSWRRNIVVPKAIDPAKSIFRINLTDYDWDERTWDAIANVNPYGVDYTTDAAREIAQLTQTARPYVRGDWFVHTAARPPLYHTLLKMPASDHELENRLFIDVAEDIRKEQVRRAGFNGSGVSQNNRLLERHATGYGAYWRSYDFGSNTERKNLFRHPLGPGAADNAFQQDGGELIFNLPNKLQAYMLVNAAGNRIDKGPLNIVSDPKQKDRTVVNGISCMSCHSQGMIYKNDQVRDAVLKTEAGYAADELAIIKRLYPPKEEFDKLLDEDVKHFKRAVEATGTVWGAPEPIEGLSLRYESEVGLRLAAAEAGVTEEEFLRALANGPADLNREFSALRSEGGTVQRDVMEKEFGQITRVLQREHLLP